VERFHLTSQPRPYGSSEKRWVRDRVGVDRDDLPLDGKREGQIAIADADRQRRGRWHHACSSRRMATALVIEHVARNSSMR